MASKYADLFEYASFAVTRKFTIEYTDVKLLNDLCGKKAGVSVNKIVLNPANGTWSIPKTNGTRPAPVPTPKKKVEFKGVHIRFEDSEDKSPLLDKDESLDLVYIPNKIPSSTFKVFQGRKRIYDLYKEYDFPDDFSNYMYDLVGDDNIVVNHVKDLVRVAGSDLETMFEVNKRYKLPFGNYSIVRVY